MIYQSTMSRVRRAFTLVELLVVIGIIALLISVLLPALSSARKQANAVACASNMKQMGIALQLYLNAYRNTYPGHLAPQGGPGGPSIAVWPAQLRRMMKATGGSQKMFRCPERPDTLEWLPNVLTGTPVATTFDEQYGYVAGESTLLCDAPGGATKFSYGYNDWGSHDSRNSKVGNAPGDPQYFVQFGRQDEAMYAGVGYGLGGDVGGPGQYQRANRVRRPADMICITETNADGHYDFNCDPNNPTEWPQPIHKKGCNVLYADGHVAFKLQQDLVLQDLKNPEDVIQWGKKLWGLNAPQWNANNQN